MAIGLLVGLAAWLSKLEAPEQGPGALHDAREAWASRTPPPQIASGPRTIAASEVREDESVGDDPSVPHDSSADAAARAAEETLRMAAEASLTGTLDVEALLDSAMSLADLSIDPKLLMDPELVEVEEHGVRKYPLRDPTSGIERATLGIGPATGEDGVRALSLHLAMKRRVRPYVVEGAARFGPQVNLNLVIDRSGSVRQRGIIVALGISPDNARMASPGSPASTIVEGVACIFDVSGSGADRLMMHGSKDGRLVRWESPIALVGPDATEPWEEIRQFLWNRFLETQP